MSEENLETFKRGLDAAERRDVEALLAEVHPEVEWHAALPMLGRDAVYRGHDGVREFTREVWGAFDEFRFDFPQFREAGNQVVATGHFRARGLASGVESEMPLGYVVDFKDGKVFRLRPYLDPNEALEAAGLSE